MKITAMQTGSVLSDLMEALAPAQNAAPEGGAFGSVLEDAAQLLQTAPPKESVPVQVVVTAQQELPVIAGEVVSAMQAAIAAVPQEVLPEVLPEIAGDAAVPTMAEKPVAQGGTVPRGDAEVVFPRVVRAHEKPEPQQEDARPAGMEVLPEAGAAVVTPAPVVVAKAEPKAEDDAPQKVDDDPEQAGVVQPAMMDAPAAVVAPVVVEKASVPAVADEPAPVAVHSSGRAAAAYASLQTAAQHHDVPAAEPAVIKPVGAEPVKTVVVQEQVQADVVKPEVAEPQPMNAGGAKPETPHAEAVRPQPVKPAAVKMEGDAADVVKPDVVKADVVKPEIGKVEVVKPETVRAEVVKPEVAKVEDVQPKVVAAQAEVATKQVDNQPDVQASRFQVTQGVAGYREQTFSGLLRKSDTPAEAATEVPAEAQPVVTADASATEPVSVEKPLQSVFEEAPAEKPVVATRQQQVAEAKPAVAIDPKPVAAPAPEAEVATAVEVRPEEQVRDPRKPAAAGQQAVRPEPAAHRQEAAKTAASEGEPVAQPVVQAAVRPKAAAAGTGGNPQQSLAENHRQKHVDNAQQSELRPQAPFITAMPAQAPDLHEVAQNPVHQNILNQVREKLETDMPQKSGEVTVRLHPEELGELTISVRMDGRTVKVEVSAETATAKQALMENVDRLKETFAKQNLTMEQFDVSTGNGGRFQQAQREARPQQQAAWFGGYRPDNDLPAAEVQKVAAYYKPRENSLIDVRF